MAYRYFGVTFRDLSTVYIEFYSYSRFRLLVDFIKKADNAGFCKRPCGKYLSVFKSDRCLFALSGFGGNTDL